MNRQSTTLAVTALLALGATTAMACPLAYSINFSGEFGVIDLATGAFTPFTTLDNTPAGLAGAPGGPFYTVDGVTGHLLRIGADGKVADVGDTKTGPNAGPNGISVLGSLADGTIYALDFSNKLFRINKDTAALTLVGAVPSLPAQEMEYDGNMTTSLGGNGTQLFYTVEISDGPRKTGPTLYTINPANLTVTNRALKLPSRVIGSGQVNGVFYLFGEEGQIVKLDTATGAAATVSTYDSGLTEDTPPLTGIFGVIGALEPNTISDHAQPTARAARNTSRQKWPPRYAPLPHRVH